MLAQVLAVASGGCLAAASFLWESRYRPVNLRAAIILAAAILWLGGIALFPLSDRSAGIPPANYSVMSQDLSLTPNELQIIDARHKQYMALRSE